MIEKPLFAMKVICFYKKKSDVDNISIIFLLVLFFL